MQEESSDLKERLVTGFARGGRRRRFDPQAKRELVQACLQPGVSVARMALEHGLNANLLRKWISGHVREHSGVTTDSMAGSTAPAFIPVVAVNRTLAVKREAHATAASVPGMPSLQSLPLPSRLIAELPNGVMLKLECTSNDATLVAAMIETLGRCDVSARR